MTQSVRGKISRTVYSHPIFLGVGQLTLNYGKTPPHEKVAWNGAWVILFHVFRSSQNQDMGSFLTFLIFFKRYFVHILNLELKFLRFIQKNIWTFGIIPISLVCKIVWWWIEEKTDVFVCLMSTKSKKKLDNFCSQNVGNQNTKIFFYSQ